MSTQAGKAVVPFSGDFSGLIEGAAATSAKIGEGFTRGILAPVTLVSAAIATAVGLSIDLASKFDTSLSMIQANMGITAQQAAAIGTAFLGTGGQVTFTANDIAQAFAPVSGQLDLLNGHALTAAQSLGVMNAAMALAESTGQPLLDVTAGLVSVMVAYHEPVANAAAVTDILANASKDLNQPVSEIASVIDKLHGKLGDATPPLAQVAGLMVDLARNGVPARSVVQDVSSAIDHLIAPSKGAAKEMSSLHLTTLDAHGSFVGMDSILGQLLPKYDEMTPAQQHLTSVTLFGAAAADAMTAIILQGPAAFDKLTGSVSKSGSAQQGAKTATDNLGGSWDKLRGKAVDFLTSVGEKFSPVLKNLADWVTGTLLPDMQQFSGWITTTAIPALQMFANWVAVNIIPTLTQFGAAVSGIGQWMLTNLLPPMEAIVRTVGPDLLGIFKFLGDHIWIVEAAAGALLGRFIAIKTLGMVEALATMGAAFLTFAGEQGVGSALMAIGGLGGSGGLVGALGRTKLALAGIGDSTVAAAGQMELGFGAMETSAATATAGAGAAFSGMLLPIALAGGAIVGLGLLAKNLADSTDPQKIHDQFVNDLQTPGNAAYETLHGDNLRAISDLEDFARAKGWSDIVTTARKSFDDLLSAHISLIQGLLSQNQTYQLDALEKIGALSAAQKRALDDFSNRFHLVSADVIATSAQVALKFTGDQIKQMLAAGLLSASVAQISLDIQGNAQALADSAKPWTVWSAIADANVNAVRADLANATSAVDDLNNLLNNAQGAASKFSNYLNRPGITQGLQNFQNAIAHPPAPPIKGHASGGLMHFGETAWLGEAGPEIGTLTPAGLMVTPHRQSSPSSSLGSGVVIHAPVSIVVHGMTSEDVVPTIRRELLANNAFIFDALKLAT